MGRPRDTGRASAAALLRAEGLSNAEIARRLHAGRGTVARWLGPHEKAGRPRRPGVDGAEIRRLRDSEGMSWRQIARVTGMAQSGVRKRYARPDGAEG